MTMGNQPIISIIVPVYKVEPYLRQCVDSILNQTYRNLEVILIDDGSPDKCGEICDEYAREDDRVVVIHKENGGQGSARNAGLQAAKGQYIGFVDSDDWIISDMYQTLYDMCRNTGSDIAQISIGVSKEHKSDSSTENRVLTVEGKDILRKFLYDGLYSRLEAYSICSKLYKTDLFKEVSFPQINHSEDYAVNSRLLQKCERFAFSNKVCYVYNHFSGNASATESKLNDRDFDIIRTFDDVCTLLQDETYRDIAKLAKVGCAMCDCGLLMKMAIYGCDATIENPKDVIKHLEKKLRGNFWTLIGAPMRFRRKILMAGFCVNYTMVEKAAKLYREMRRV